MARATRITTNFTAGELSPLLDGRVDLRFYFNGTREMTNFVTLPQGPAKRRSGSRFIVEAKDSTKFARMVPFVFSVLQAYMLEFGDLYIRFFRDKGRIESPPPTPVEVVSPYLEAELDGLQFTQSADVLYIAHPNHQLRKLTRTSHTAWTLTKVELTDGPYDDPDTSGITITPSGTTGAITLTASASLFTTDDVGRLYRIKHTTTYGYVIVSGFTSDTLVDATVRIDLDGSASAADEWRAGIFSDTKGPTALTLHEERMVLAGATDHPQRMDFSKSGDFEDFTPGTLADDAIGIVIASDQVNAIRWLVSKGVLLVGTFGAEFRIGATDLQSALTPDNVAAVRETLHGSSAIQPRAVSDAVLFLQRQSTKLHELTFSFEKDGYIAPDLALRAEHITRSGIRAMAFQDEPYGVLWACRQDGGLIALTYLREQQVTAWQQHPVGGGGLVESVATIPTETGDDELWMMVKRTIGGVTKRYVEVLEPFFADDADQEDAWFVDSGLKYDGVPVSAVGGYDHLEGETVQVLADGAAHPDVVVGATVAGQIDLKAGLTASVVVAGKGFTSRIKPVRFEAGQGEGTAQGKQQRVNQITMRFYRSLGGQFGRPGKLDKLPFRNAGAPMNQAPALFSGDRKQTFPGNWSKDAEVIIEQTQPLPMTLVALIVQLGTSDG